MPIQLWSDPSDGLDPQYASWNWTAIRSWYDGPTKTPPNSLPGWERWYFIYEQPDGTQVQVSADRDPQTGQWFNPHLSSSNP
jgi:hypothetical protein